MAKTKKSLITIQQWLDQAPGVVWETLMSLNIEISPYYSLKENASEPFKSALMQSILITSHPAIREAVERTREVLGLSSEVLEWHGNLGISFYVGVAASPFHDGMGVKNDEARELENRFNQEMNAFFLQKPGLGLNEGIWAVPIRLWILTGHFPVPQLGLAEMRDYGGDMRRALEDTPETSIAPYVKLVISNLMHEEITKAFDRGLPIIILRERVYSQESLLEAIKQISPSIISKDKVENITKTLPQAPFKRSDPDIVKLCIGSLIVRQPNLSNEQLAQFLIKEANKDENYTNGRLEKASYKLDESGKSLRYFKKYIRSYLNKISPL